MVRVKICCMGSMEEVAHATAAGAHALGFVSEMPSGPGVVDDTLIAKMASHTPPGLSRFLLTSRLDPEGIAAHVDLTGVDTVQICDHVERGVWKKLRSLSSVRIVQVVHVLATDPLTYAATAAPHVDALLLDSGKPGADFKELGGTGRTHDWELSAEIVRGSPVPVWLAGGLHAGNVAEAIAKVQPFGVDLCTGVRSNGALDLVKLHAFIAAVRTAEERSP